MTSGPAPRAVPAPARIQSAWWRWVVGLGLLAILVAAIGAGRLKDALQTASPLWLGVAFAGSFAWLLLGASNVWLLLRRLQAVPPVEFLRVYLESWLLALVLPGQLGDASQVLLLRRTGVPVRKSAAAYLLDKATSLLWLGSIGTVGIAMFAPPGAGAVVLWIGGVCGLAALAAWIIGRRLRRPAGWLSRVQSFGKATLSNLRSFQQYPGTVVTNLGLTVAKWALNTGVYVAAFRAVRTSVALGPVATIPFISSLVGYVPVTVSGAGTMELTAVALFQRHGLQPAIVLSVFLLVRAAMVLAAFAMLILVSSFRPVQSAR